jgi:hypothetical protein
MNVRNEARSSCARRVVAAEDVGQIFAGVALDLEQLLHLEHERVAALAMPADALGETHREFAARHGEVEAAHDFARGRPRGRRARQLLNACR